MYTVAIGLIFLMYILLFYLSFIILKSARLDVCCKQLLWVPNLAKIRERIGLWSKTLTWPIDRTREQSESCASMWFPQLCISYVMIALSGVAEMRPIGTESSLKVTSWVSSSCVSNVPVNQCMNQRRSHRSQIFETTTSRARRGGSFFLLAFIHYNGTFAQHKTIRTEKTARAAERCEAFSQSTRSTTLLSW